MIDNIIKGIPFISVIIDLLINSIKESLVTVDFLGTVVEFDDEISRVVVRDWSTVAIALGNSALALNRTRSE
jgi:hypothetical protein